MRNSWTCNVTVIMMRSMQFDSVCMIKFSAGYLTGRRKRGKTGKIVGGNWSWKLKQKRGRIILCCQRIRRVLEYSWMLVNALNPINPKISWIQSTFQHELSIKKIVNNTTSIKKRTISEWTLLNKMWKNVDLQIFYHTLI